MYYIMYILIAKLCYEIINVRDIGILKNYNIFYLNLTKIIRILCVERFEFLIN